MSGQKSGNNVKINTYTTSSVTAKLDALRRRDAVRQQRLEGARSGVGNYANASSSMHPSVMEFLSPAEYERHCMDKARSALLLRNLHQTAGPPPPQSWCNGGEKGKESSVNAALDVKEQLRSLQTISRLYQQSSSGLQMPSNPSLAHSCLRHIAMNWRIQMVPLLESYLCYLPYSLWPIILSYVAVYSPAGMSGKGLALYIGNVMRVDYQTRESTGLNCLDLSFSLNYTLSLQTVESILIAYQCKASVGDDWQEMDIDESLPPFGFLRTLSLGYPRRIKQTHQKEEEQWWSLYRILELIPHLSALSLAGWSKPPQLVVKNELTLSQLATRTICLETLDLSHCPGSWPIESLKEILSSSSSNWQSLQRIILSSSSDVDDTFTKAINTHRSMFNQIKVI